MYLDDLFCSALILPATGVCSLRQAGLASTQCPLGASLLSSLAGMSQTWYLCRAMSKDITQRTSGILWLVCGLDEHRVISCTRASMLFKVDRRYPNDIYAMNIEHPILSPLMQKKRVNDETC